MRFYILVCAFFFLCSFVFRKGQKSNYTPPGTLLIKDSLFMDKVEVSNRNWKEFLRFNNNGKLRDSSEVASLLPDSTITIRVKDLGKIKMDEYFNDPKFDDFPIVGISHDQVTKYCIWRTQQVNLLIIKKINIPEIQIEYRLPTLQEWELIAKNKLDTIQFPYGQDIYYTIDEIKYKTFNCYYPEMSSLNYIRACNDTIRNIKKNSYGIYNLIGNVCEMLQESGLAKGGHYDALLENCKIKEIAE